MHFVPGKSLTICNTSSANDPWSADARATTLRNSAGSQGLNKGFSVLPVEQAVPRLPEGAQRLTSAKAHGRVRVVGQQDAQETPRLQATEAAPQVHGAAYAVIPSGCYVCMATAPHETTSLAQLDSGQAVQCIWGLCSRSRLSVESSRLLLNFCHPSNFKACADCLQMACACDWAWVLGVPLFYHSGKLLRRTARLRQLQQQ